jgi:hypothetical protein
MGHAQRVALGRRPCALASALGGCFGQILLRAHFSIVFFTNFSILHLSSVLSSFLLIIIIVIKLSFEST